MERIQHFNLMKQRWAITEAWSIGEDDFYAQKLMFHWALLVNAEEHGYEHRYCYDSLETIHKAIDIYKETGNLTLWKKDHTNNISVKGKYLYKEGMLQSPEYACGTVEWEIK